VEVLAKKHKISIDKPISSLSEQSINLLLYGTPNGPSESTFDMDETTVVSAYEGVFEGVVPMLKRWFTGTGITEALREWVEQFMELKHCPSCEGARLKKESLWFKVAGKNIAEISDLNLDKLLNWFEGIENHLSKKDNAIAKDILKEIRERVGFLLDVGLTYLSLSRPSKTLSGGESQRIRLATQIGSQLQGITYILDEPSIGLHQRDNMQLIKALQNLRVF
jgi:excinuclease ABC subunit A